MDKKTVRDIIIEVITRMFDERAIKLRKIVLFGSYVLGTAGEDSDVDIIVVSPDFRGINVFGRAKKANRVSGTLVRELRKPVDIIYYSDLEWDEDRPIVIEDAKEYGEVIYDSELR